MEQSRVPSVWAQNELPTFSPHQQVQFASICQLREMYGEYVNSSSSQVLTEKKRTSVEPCTREDNLVHMMDTTGCFYPLVRHIHKDPDPKKQWELVTSDAQLPDAQHTGTNESSRSVFCEGIRFIFPHAHILMSPLAVDTERSQVCRIDPTFEMQLKCCARYIEQHLVPQCSSRDPTTKDTAFNLFVIRVQIDGRIHHLVEHKNLIQQYIRTYFSQVSQWVDIEIEFTSQSHHVYRPTDKDVSSVGTLRTDRTGSSGIPWVEIIHSPLTVANVHSNILEPDQVGQCRQKTDHEPSYGSPCVFTPYSSVRTSTGQLHTAHVLYAFPSYIHTQEAASIVEWIQDRLCSRHRDRCTTCLEGIWQKSNRETCSHAGNVEESTQTRVFNENESSTIALFWALIRYAQVLRATLSTLISPYQSESTLAQRPQIPSEASNKLWTWRPHQLPCSYYNFHFLSLVLEHLLESPWVYLSLLHRLVSSSENEFFILRVLYFWWIGRPNPHVHCFPSQEEESDDKGENPSPDNVITLSDRLVEIMFSEFVYHVGRMTNPRTLLCLHFGALENSLERCRHPREAQSGEGSGDTISVGAQSRTQDFKRRTLRENWLSKVLALRCSRWNKENYYYDYDDDDDDDDENKNNDISTEETNAEKKRYSKENDDLIRRVFWRTLYQGTDFFCSPANESSRTQKEEEETANDGNPSFSAPPREGSAFTFLDLLLEALTGVDISGSLRGNDCVESHSHAIHHFYGFIKRLNQFGYPYDETVQLHYSEQSWTHVCVTLFHVYCIGLLANSFDEEKLYHEKSRADSTDDGDNTDQQRKKTMSVSSTVIKSTFGDSNSYKTGEDQSLIAEGEYRDASLSSSSTASKSISADAQTATKERGERVSSSTQLPDEKINAYHLQRCSQRNHWLQCFYTGWFGYFWRSSFRIPADLFEMDRPVNKPLHGALRFAQETLVRGPLFLFRVLHEDTAVPQATTQQEKS